MDALKIIQLYQLLADSITGFNDKCVGLKLYKQMSATFLKIMQTFYN
jgi:hypothetical protein